ncbi:HTH domain-containing protein [Phenylobacterium sp.]|uniref:helix-turn-helix transcriptional regulator n=1 Tax=Phenylobacterium sp. TaxID=1871053 RepID=UPI0025F66C09|nr:HTH domain-containing protein [Phenylobacterium sp.]
MRASRLLRLLLILQNRGRMTSAQLATELEVARRTILRDVDALTEAGLPIIVHQGNQGGIELGFNYRTRLTGLASDEAEAMAVLLSRPVAELAMLGLEDAAQRARAKLLESFPDPVRAKIEQARRRFRFDLPAADAPDVRLPALADAVREARVVRIDTRSESSRTIHPIGLMLRVDGWFVIDAAAGEAAIALADCGDIAISARRFGPPDAVG